MMARSRGSSIPLRLLVGALILAGLGLVFFFGSDVASYARGMFVSILAPRVSGDMYAGLSKDALIARLSAAERDVSRTKYQSILYGALVAENASLRKAAGASSIAPGIVGRVVARPPRTHYDTLLIDRGSEQGVHENDVAVYEGIALGRVSSVSSGTSLVSLYSSPGVTNDVILGEPRAVAVAKGLGGGAFELSVPQGVTIALGDAVLFPGTESLVLGVVKSVSAEARDVSQTVRLSMPLSFADLDFIRILPSK